MFSARKIALTVLLTLTATVGVGCTHLAPITETHDAQGKTVYISVLRYADGTPRTTVLETVIGSDDTCDILSVERRFYDRSGMLMERTTDRERCQVVELRVAETFDLAGATSTRVASRDVDRDGMFDKETRTSRGLSHSELASLSK